jgi:hypothetical protein
MTRWLWLATAAALAGCSSGNPPDGGNPGNDSGQTPDSGQAPDSGHPGDSGTADFTCGANPPCPLTQTCCAAIVNGQAAASCVSSCGNPNDVIGCSGPQDCSGGTPVCCAKVSFVGGIYPGCDAGSFGAVCKAGCANQFAQDCQSADQVILCQTGTTDCPSDAGNNMCCTAAQGGASLRFCMSGLVAFSLSARTCN